ncbi:MAG: HAMP domain-containing protein, partial [Chloroflexi bacterium]
MAPLAACRWNTRAWTWLPKRAISTSICSGKSPEDGTISKDYREQTSSITHQQDRAGMRISQAWKGSLLVRLVGYYILFSALMVGLMASFAYLNAANSLESSVLDRLATIATLKEENFNRWVYEQRRNIVFVAALPEVRSKASSILSPETSSAEKQSAHDDLVNYLNLIVTSTPDSHEILLLDLQGVVAISTTVSHVGRSEAGQEYFIQGNTLNYVQSAYYSSLIQRNTITVSTPLFNSKQQRIGVLASHLNLRQADIIIRERTGLGETGEAYLISREQLLITDDPFIQGEGTFAGTSKGIELALQGQDGAERYTNQDGRPVFGAYRWDNEQNVALLVEIGEEEALRSARQLFYVIASIGLAVVTALGFIIYAIGKRITYPIVNLTHTAAGIASGDLSLTASVLTEDEVGQLAQAFNKMTGELRNSLRGLELELAERKKIETALRESESTTRALLEAIPDAIFVFNKEGIFINFIPGQSFATLIPPSQFLGKSFEQVLSPDLAKQLRHYHKRALQENTLQTFEYSMPGKDGVEYFEARLRAAQEEKVIAIVRDVTARIKYVEDISQMNDTLEQRVTERTAELEQTVRELESFSYTISHDLRAPLRGVVGLSSILLKEHSAQISEEGQALLKRMRETALFMGSLIDDLLAFSRLARQPIHPQMLTTAVLQIIVKELIEKLRQKEPGRDIQIRVGELSPCTADPALLKAVFLNLLSNAFKFT